MKTTLKSIGLLTVMILVSLQNFGQQSPLYTQYYNNFSIINPAYAGSQGRFTSTLTSRSDWAGEEAGGPRTYSFSLHGPTGKKVGLGLSIVNDEVSVLSETHVFADFSYSLTVSESSTLAFGLKAGGSFLDIDLLKLGIDNDPLFGENTHQFNPNFGVGAYYYSDKFFASVSTVNILKTDRNNLNNSIVSNASDEMVFYLSSGYTFDMSKSFKLKPSFMVSAENGAPVNTDIATSFIWNDKIEFGISHRLDVATSGLIQMRISDNFKFGYSYDALHNNLSNYNNGSHEISLVINWGKGKNKIPIEDEKEDEREEDEIIE